MYSIHQYTISIECLSIFFLIFEDFNFLRKIRILYKIRVKIMTFFEDLYEDVFFQYINIANILLRLLSNNLYKIYLYLFDTNIDELFEEDNCCSLSLSRYPSANFLIPHLDNPILRRIVVFYNRIRTMTDSVRRNRDIVNGVPIVIAISKN